MKTPLEFYEHHSDIYSSESQFLQRRINTISIGRFVSAVCAVVCAYFALYGGLGVSFLAWLLMFCFWFVVFGFLVTWHTRLFARKERIDALYEVNQKEIQAMKGNWEKFPDGSEYLSDAEFPQADDYALDLDIFGKASLFQRVNRTVTPVGAKVLAKYLITPLSSIFDIHERQQILAELKERSDFRQEWATAKGRKTLSEAEMTALSKWLGEEGYLQKRVFVRGLMVLFPLVFVISFAWLCVEYRPDNTDNTAVQLVWGSFFANMMLAMTFIRNVTREAALMQRFAPLLTVYAQLFRIVQEAEKKSSFTTSAPRSIVACSEEARGAIHRLSQLLKRFDEGTSLAGALLLNGTVLWNLHCALLMERWRAKYKHQPQEWFAAIAEMDALVSLAGFSFNNPTFTTPTFLDGNKAVLRVSGLGHPFLAVDECVVNSISFDDETGHIAIITGANMAGKSTFLRALGLNTVLAMVGLPVFAEKFDSSLLTIQTSMRATDSLERHESYFFAELKRLQKIMRHVYSSSNNNSPETVPTLVLLDEILRGTNSADKKSGTIGLLRQFIPAAIPMVIATHDTDVGTLEQESPNNVRNYCFEGIVLNDELTFEYKLQRGIAANKNATFLMQKMGLIQA